MTLVIYLRSFNLDEETGVAFAFMPELIAELSQSTSVQRKSFAEAVYEIWFLVTDFYKTRNVTTVVCEKITLVPYENTVVTFVPTEIRND
jgi:hypothetical protein